MFCNTVFIIILLSLCGLFGSCGKKNDVIESDKNRLEISDESKLYQAQDIGNHQGVRSIKIKNIGPLAQVFNDSNHVQLEAARRMGIDPIIDFSYTYFMKRPIVKVVSNQYYHIDSLTHSIPYLVPEAALLLEDIGKNFIDSLHSRGGDSYQIKVTSILRTPKTVERLRKVNVNATDSSTHQYATTFDISYSNFYCLDANRQINQGDLKNLLGEVLLDLRKQGRCLVKYENKTACFHITVAK